MENVVPILGAVSLLLVVPVLFRVRRFVRGTTLVTAWRWAAAAWIVLGRRVERRIISFLPASLQDQLWYAAAILGLCPPIAVLGAKRPGSRVWAAFVVLPLVLVFAWPALVGVGSANSPRNACTSKPRCSWDITWSW